MKAIILLLLLPFFVQVHAQKTPIKYQNERGDTHLMGAMERMEFEQEPYKEWFDKEYKGYELDESVVQVLNKNYNKNIQVKIFLGTWCGDTKRELSRFLKLVDHSKIDPSTIEFIGLDNRSDTYKQSPQHEEEGLNIHRVPTFIFYDGEEEIARIVESPMSSIEKDVAQIYAGVAPTPKYFTPNYIGNYMKDHTMAEADSMIHQFSRFFQRKTVNEGELNTFGYVSLAAGNINQAIIAFKLNTLMYPASANAFDSLAEAYKITGNTDLAIDNYMKAYSMNPKTDNPVAMIKEIVSGKNINIKDLQD